MSNYIRQSLITFLALLAATALFNIWADPYNIYRFQSADSKRMSRVDQGLSMRLSKPWQVIQRNPTSAVIGSSRSGSIHPTNISWTQKSTFNLSMPGLTLQEMVHTIEHAQHAGPLSQLVIGLEYETFISGDYIFGLGFTEARLADTDTLVFYRQAIKDFSSTLLTTSALTRSIMAISHMKPSTTLYFPDGSWKNTSRIWRGESGYVSVGKNLVRLAKNHPSIYRDNFEVFSTILAYCYQQDITVTLFMSPEHIFLTDLRNAVAASSQWGDFHQDIATLNEFIANKYGKAPFALLGFNHLRGIVDEPLPRGDVSPQAWFRDGIHFRNDLGKVIMDQISNPYSNRAYRITSSNVQNYLDEVETLRLEFEAVNAADIEGLQSKIL